MNQIVLRPMFYGVVHIFQLYRIVEAVLLVAAIFMMVKASQDEAYALPLFGELAQRSVTEG